MAMQEQRHAVEELVYRTCLALDAKDWTGFLALCDPAFRYTITTFSPELKKDMVWLDHDRAGMEVLLGNLPKHNSDHSPITRHATVYTTEFDDAKGQANVVSAVQVFRTTLDGGATELFAVGHFHDTVNLTGGGPKLLNRSVRLDTRLLGIGYHIPF
jgi:methanesulfonate monooxygenase small subunit